MLLDTFDINELVDRTLHNIVQAGTPGGAERIGLSPKLSSVIRSQLRAAFIEMHDKLCQAKGSQTGASRSSQPEDIKTKALDSAARATR